jgi:hypothetical protein
MHKWAKSFKKFINYEEMWFLKMKILIVDFNLFEETSHVVSNCDVEQCRIIWKPNYVKGAKNKP